MMEANSALLWSTRTYCAGDPERHGPESHCILIPGEGTAVTEEAIVTLVESPKARLQAARGLESSSAKYVEWVLRLWWCFAVS